MLKMVKTAIVFLHGSGSSGLDLRQFFESVPLENFGYETFFSVLTQSSMNLFTPTAENRRYTAMGGERMNIWFDREYNFLNAGMNGDEDLYGIDRSFSQLLLLIEDLETKYDHIFLGGHSMGGCLCLHAFRKKLSSKIVGVFSVGSFIVHSSDLFKTNTQLNSDLPLLMMHGYYLYYHFFNNYFNSILCIYFKVK
jgi:predicted esterase